MLKRHAVSPRTARMAPVRVVWALASAACIISLFTSSCGGDESVGIPDFNGMTFEEAQSLAQDEGLQLTEGDSLPSFLPAGTVLWQDPLPGAPTDSDVVQVNISRDPIPVKVRDVRAYDVDGDGRENNDLLPNLYDGDLNTSWSTETTYRSPDFSGLGDKIGVGFSFWLEEGATMLKVTYTQTGWKGEVQKIVDEMPIALAQLGEKRQVSWTQPITSGRIWFTQLAPLPDSDRYAAEINEIEFYR